MAFSTSGRGSYQQVEEAEGKQRAVFVYNIHIHPIPRAVYKEVVLVLWSNPVVISVSVMIVLCLFNLNIVLALLIAAMTAGFAAGMSIPATMGTLISGMGGNSETALAYFLLGAFAVAINRTGLATLACRKLEKIVSGKKILLMFFIAGIACLSGTLIPVHIAFIPILIPPLLLLFNELKADRRADQIGRASCRERV